MALFVTCSCGKKLSAKDALAGKKIKCPKCGAAVRVPRPSESESGSESDSEDASDSADESESDAAPAKARKRDESEDESSDDESSEEERPAKKGLGRGKLGTARRKRTAATVTRDAAPPAGESFLAGMGFRLLGGVVVLIIVLAINLFTGSAAYDASFDKVQNGMARQAVIDVMGKPEVALNEGGAELLGFEAIDSRGRYSKAKHTFYFVVLRNGVVESKRRMEENEFNAMVGRKR